MWVRVRSLLLAAMLSVSVVATGALAVPALATTVTTNRILKVTATGALDSSFVGTGNGFNSDVTVLQRTSNGQFIAAGAFTSFTGYTWDGTATSSTTSTTTVNRIARLTASGALDLTFGAASGGFNNTVHAMAIDSAGNIIVGGRFANFTGFTFNGTTTTSSSSTTSGLGNIARLTPNGAIDTTYNAGGFDTFGWVYAIAVDSSNRAVLAGLFTTFGSTTTNSIARLNANGSLDTTFTNNSGFGGSFPVRAQALAIDTSGGIVVGGRFGSYQAVGGATTIVQNLVRLTSSGAVDNTFLNNGGGCDQEVTAVAVDGSGRVLVGGDFAQYTDRTGSSSAVKRFIRLSSTGALDTAFTSGGQGFGAGTPNVIKVDTVTGDILAAGSMNSYWDPGSTVSGTVVGRVVRLNSSGYLNTTFNTNISLSDAVPAMAFDGSGGIVFGGSFTSFNGTVAIAVTFDPNGAPGSPTVQSSTAAANLTANTFTRAGYTFGGWAATNSSTTVAYADGASYPFSSATTLYAIWTMNSVSFNNGGGTGTMPAQSSATAANLTANTFTRPGYTYRGWAPTNGASVATIADGGSYPFSTSGTTLYAVWAQNFTVTFDANGGSGTMTPQATYTAANLTANSLTRTGYTFAGWNTVANGSGVSYSDQASYPFAGSTTLYAQWTAVPVASASPTVSSAASLASSGAAVLPAIALASLLGLAGLALLARRRFGGAE